MSPLTARLIIKEIAYWQVLYHNTFAQAISFIIKIEGDNQLPLYKFHQNTLGIIK
jgi:hypothetical protein